MVACGVVSVSRARGVRFAAISRAGRTHHVGERLEDVRVVGLELHLRQLVAQVVAHVVNVLVLRSDDARVREEGQEDHVQANLSDCAANLDAAVRLAQVAHGQLACNSSGRRQCLLCGGATRGARCVDDGGGTRSSRRRRRSGGWAAGASAPARILTPEKRELLEAVVLGGVTEHFGEDPRRAVLSLLLRHVHLHHHRCRRHLGRPRGSPGHRLMLLRPRTACDPRRRPARSHRAVIGATIA